MFGPRVLYLTNCYQRADELAVGAAERHRLHVAQLVDDGWRADVVTSYVSALDREVPEAFKRQRVVVENDGAMTLYRTYSPPRFGRGTASRLADAGTYVVNMVRAADMAPRPDIVLASMPTLFIGLAGEAIARRHRVPLLLEVRDLWTESLIGAGYGRIPGAVTVSRRLEHHLWRTAAHIVTTSEGQRQVIIDSGIPQDHITVVTNGLDTDLVDAAVPVARSRLGGDEDSFIGVFAGKHGIYSGLETVIEAAAMLSPEDGFRVALIGDGHSKGELIETAARRRLSHVTFVDPVPKTHIFNYLAAADFFLLPYSDSDAWRRVLPNKTFDYMGMGKPLIVAVRSGTLTEFVTKANAGICVPPGDPRALAGAIRELRDDPARCRALGEAGRQYVMEHFTRRQTCRQFSESVGRVMRR